MQHHLDSWNPYPLPELPEPLGRLRELAYNLWWSWHPEVRGLFAAIDPGLWSDVSDNPVRFLRRVAPARLAAAAADRGYRTRLAETLATYDAYMASGHLGDTPFARKYPHLAGDSGQIAYFSAEFGLHESLPIYSGGLGVLAGDHCKAASDMGVPLVAIGLLYHQSYFTQSINSAGEQEARYDRLLLADAPIRPAILNGNPVVVTVLIGAWPIHAAVWFVQIGRVKLFLLDTDLPGNDIEDRELGSKLYGGGPDMRLRQEMILGIGGVKALRLLGIEPRVWHLNEGHAAFAPLEAIRERVEGGLAFEEARVRVAAGTAFTTHTPVKAGHDEFSEDFILAHFDGYAPQLGLTEREFLALGHRPGDGGNFSMTALAFHLATHFNGVSRRHGEVSRDMWREMWPERPADEVPIGSITNGVHQATWQAPELGVLLRQTQLSLRASGPSGESPALADVLAAVPDGALWGLRLALKRRLIDTARRHEHERRDRLNWFDSTVAAADQLLDPAALTLGFARRFATYKRADLLFHDPDRLAAILNHPDHPVQILFAGKAHPADQPGQAKLAGVYRFSQQPQFAGRILVLEDYGIALARQLVQGVDVWLNTPRRPQEASGTSGQKAAMNGVPNLSVLDGWWIEGYHGDNGWPIGPDAVDPAMDEAAVDAADAESLYEALEQAIGPAYYERDADGLPRRWLACVRAAIREAVPAFTAERMMGEYVAEVYAPAAEAFSKAEG